MASSARLKRDHPQALREPISAGGRRNVGVYLNWVVGAIGVGLVVVTTLIWSGVLRQAGSSSDMRSASDFTTAATPVPLGAPEIGTANRPSPAQGRPSAQHAPDFTAQLLGGGGFTLSEQRGNPVLILFTASWCFTCIPEINKMAQLQNEFGGRGLRQLVLSVDPTDTEADFAALRQRTSGLNLSWALDPGQKATVAYGIRATDTKVLVDAGGLEGFRSIGATGLETLRQHVVASIR